MWLCRAGEAESQDRGGLGGGLGSGLEVTGLLVRTVSVERNDRGCSPIGGGLILPPANTTDAERWTVMQEMNLDHDWGAWGPHVCQTHPSLGLTGIVSLREVAATGVSCHPPPPAPGYVSFPLLPERSLVRALEMFSWGGTECLQDGAGDSRCHPKWRVGARAAMAIM